MFRRVKESAKRDLPRAFALGSFASEAWASTPLVFEHDVLSGLNHNALQYPYHGILETPTDAKVNGARVIGDLLASSPQARRA